MIWSYLNDKADTQHPRPDKRLLRPLTQREEATGGTTATTSGATAVSRSASASVASVLASSRPRASINLFNVGTQDQLPNQLVSHMRLLFDVLSIDPQAISDRLCPVRLSTGQCVVLVLKEYAQDDQTHAIVYALQQHALTLLDPPIVVATPSLLGALNRQLRKVAHPVNEGSEHDGKLNRNARHVLFAILDDLIKWGIEHCASDVHLHANPKQNKTTVHFTVSGAYIQPAEFEQMTAQVMLELLGVIWMSVQGGNGAVFDPHREQQGRLTRLIDGQSVLLRWASIASDHGPCVCLRILGNQMLSDVPALETLGYLPDQLQALRKSRLSDAGAVVLAGLVGSGKSTTLACLLRELPGHRKLMTLEDPVEYTISQALQCSVAGALDEDLHTAFDRKLKAIKRSAVQDLLIGEIRDQTGGRALSDLLLAGVNVYTTVHACSALQIVNRLTSDFIGVPRSILAMPGMLKLLVYQALLPKLCPHCRLSAEQWLATDTQECALGIQRTASWSHDWLIQWCTQTQIPLKKLYFRNPHGCAHCLSLQGSQSAGYVGRTVVAEIIDPARVVGFTQAIESGSMSQLLALVDPHSERSYRYKTVLDTGLIKVAAGEIDPREIERRLGGHIAL